MAQVGSKQCKKRQNLVVITSVIGIFSVTSKKQKKWIQCNYVSKLLTFGIVLNNYKTNRKLWKLIVSNPCQGWYPLYHFVGTA